MDVGLKLSQTDPQTYVVNMGLLLTEITYISTGFKTWKT